MSDFKTLDDNAYAIENSSNENEHFTNDPYMKSLYEKNSNNYKYLSVITKVFSVLGVIGLVIVCVSILFALGTVSRQIPTGSVFMILLAILILFVPLIIFGFWFAKQLKKYSEDIKVHNNAPSISTFDTIIAQRTTVLVGLMIFTILGVIFTLIEFK